jgi:REP element-mobilizing transposase RayT
VFVWIDRYLDRSQHGPQFLRQEAVAKLVIAALLSGARLGHFRLGPFVVMGNHLHVLFFPLVPPSRLLKSLKGFTARQANRLLGRTSEPFWQKESYDHWVRSEIEWNRIASYIEEHPVKAGLVSRAQDYLWSSAHEEWREGVDRSVDAARVGAQCRKLFEGVEERHGFTPFVAERNRVWARLLGDRKGAFGCAWATWLGRRSTSSDRSSLGLAPGYGRQRSAGRRPGSHFAPA